MNLDREDFETADLLSDVGRVNPPSSELLENAREVLWSAVAEEMLASGGARIGLVEHKADRPQRAVRQRRPDNSQQAEQRRNASPEG